MSFGLKGVSHPDYPMPSWVAVLEMSEAWGVPPWQVEDQASQEWVERFLVYRSETAKEQKRRSDKAHRKMERR